VDESSAFVAIAQKTR